MSKYIQDLVENNKPGGQYTRISIRSMYPMQSQLISDRLLEMAMDLNTIVTTTVDATLLPALIDNAITVSEKALAGTDTQSGHFKSAQNASDHLDDWRKL